MFRIYLKKTRKIVEFFIMTGSIRGWKEYAEEKDKPPDKPSNFIFLGNEYRWNETTGDWERVPKPGEDDRKPDDAPPAKPLEEQLDDAVKRLQDRVERIARGEEDEAEDKETEDDAEEDKAESEAEETPPPQPDSGRQEQDRQPEQAPPPPQKTPKKKTAVPRRLRTWPETLLDDDNAIITVNARIHTPQSVIVSGVVETPLMVIWFIVFAVYIFYPYADDFDDHMAAYNLLEQAILGMAAFFIAFAAPLLLLHLLIKALFRQAAIFEFSEDLIRIKPPFSFRHPFKSGWRSYDRRERHRFYMQKRQETRWEDEGFAVPRGWRSSMLRNCRNIGLEHRYGIAYEEEITVYGINEATQLNSRLNHIDDNMADFLQQARQGGREWGEDIP